jgi:hypothetical protein
MAELPGISIPPSETSPIVIDPGGPVVHPAPEELPGSGTVTPPITLKPSFPEPEAPDTTAAPELSKLALLLLVLGLIAIAKAFTDFLNWLFRTMLGPLWPKANSPQLSTKLGTQAISNYLGSFAQGVDSELGVNFARIAETNNMLGQAILAAAVGVQTAAVKLARLEGNAAGVQSAQAALKQAQRQTRADLQRTNTQLQSQAQAQTDANHALQTRVDSLTHHIHHVLEPELDGLRSAIPTLERGTAVLEDQVKQHSEALGLAAMTGTVAVAMGRLGAGWTRCETNRNLGEALCGSSNGQVKNLLRDLLPLIDIAALCGFVRLISAMGKNPVLLDALGVFSIGVEDLLRCTGATEAPPLPVPALTLAPPQPWATLAPVHG